MRTITDPLLADEPGVLTQAIAIAEHHGYRLVKDEAFQRLTQRQTHAEIVNARIAAFPRAAQAIRNGTDRELVEMRAISEKDILRLAVELVK